MPCPWYAQHPYIETPCYCSIICQYCIDSASCTFRFYFYLNFQDCVVIAAYWFFQASFLIFIFVATFLSPYSPAFLASIYFIHVITIILWPNHSGMQSICRTVIVQDSNKNMRSGIHKENWSETNKRNNFWMDKVKKSSSMKKKQER